MKRFSVLISSAKSYHVRCAALVVAVLTISSPLRATHAQPRPSPSPAPVVTARPSPRPTTPPAARPSPPPVVSTSPEATGTARCTTEGTLVIEVPGPYGEVYVFVYKNGCRVEGKSTIDLSNGVTAGASCKLQVKEMKVDMSLELILKALAPEGVQLGELHLSCRRLSTKPVRERYSCELRSAGPTGKVLRQWTWQGNPEVVIVRCVADTTEAVQDLVKALHQRGIKFKDEHQPEFTTFRDDSDEVRWGLKLTF